MAKKKHQGKIKNSLDALCQHYQIDNTMRKKHGAFIDAQLLSEVYLAMLDTPDSPDPQVYPKKMLSYSTGYSKPNDNADKKQANMPVFLSTDTTTISSTGFFSKNATVAVKPCEGSAIAKVTTETISDKSNAINAMIALNLTVETRGSWLWVTGDTKPHKETLKTAGYKWSPNKTAWYLKPEEDKSLSFRK